MRKSRAFTLVEMLVVLNHCRTDRHPAPHAQQRPRQSNSSNMPSQPSADRRQHTSCYRVGEQGLWHVAVARGRMTRVITAPKSKQPREHRWTDLIAPFVSSTTAVVSFTGGSTSLRENPRNSVIWGCPRMGKDVRGVDPLTGRPTTVNDKVRVRPRGK